MGISRNGRKGAKVAKERNLSAVCLLVRPLRETFCLAGYQ
jgi:hypothetical protein